MFDPAFSPSGPSVLVDNTARQVFTRDGTQSVTYRVRNMAAAAQYFTWSTPNITAGPTTAPTGLSAAAPVAGTPANVIGMLAGSVELFRFPPNAWFLAGTATGFEFTPGEGR